ncbi:DUF3800 domain-containing protein [Chitinophaga sp. Cy-1792]|uniref:DUF3800 domain-containing protein n=1 Tax=Chitinophaga sp. Cy-1792 TaxID=2608339 RepID=UPI00141D8BEF|nr:DUF3800 domain-containing protein [Chitinophaga sp. Cy-1792]
MYIDESGDCGLNNSPTNFFVLSAIVIHESRWRSTLESLVKFRRSLKVNKGLFVGEEIHCSEFINKPGPLVRIKRNDRLDILNKCIDWVNDEPYISVFSVSINKQQNPNRDIFEYAWNVLLMRFENTLSYGNFPGVGSSKDMGIVISDNTEGEKLRKLVRKMRHFNTIPNMNQPGARNMKLNYVIEDPILRDSKHSLIHQMNDVTAYFARQMYEPNAYVKKKTAHNFYKRLTKCSLIKITNKNNYGVVEL